MRKEAEAVFRYLFYRENILLYKRFRFIIAFRVSLRGGENHAAAFALQVREF